MITAVSLYNHHIIAKQCKICHWKDLTADDYGVGHYCHFEDIICRPLLPGLPLPGEIRVPMTASPQDINVPRAGSPRFKKVPGGVVTIIVIL